METMKVSKVEGRNILIVGLVARDLKIGIITNYYLGYDPRKEHTITVIEKLEGTDRMCYLGHIIFEGRIEEWDREYIKL